jgi:hypothetical protein
METKITRWVMVDGQWYVAGEQPEGEIQTTGYSHQSSEEVQAGGGQIWEDPK